MDRDFLKKAQIGLATSLEKRNIEEVENWCKKFYQWEKGGKLAGGAFTTQAEELNIGLEFINGQWVPLP